VTEIHPGKKPHAPDNFQKNQNHIMSTALIKQDQQPLQPHREELSVFGSVSHFEVAQRMARALCSSQMVPDNYRGEQNLGSCLIALEMANRIGANVMSVCQNLYIVHGKPAWSSQFLIACVNASGKFSPLRYTMTGSANSDTHGCIAWATDKSGERLESPEVTIGIAKAEGWFQKNGSKWKTMPDLMLRYRAATLFARLYAPELTMGIRTDDEVLDIVEVAPVVTERPALPSFSAPATTPEPAKRGRKPKVEALPTTPVEPPYATEPDPSPSAEGFTANERSDDPLAPLQEAAAPTISPLHAAMDAAQVTPEQVLKFYNSSVKPKSQPDIPDIGHLPATVVKVLTENLLKHNQPENAIVEKIRAS